MRCFEVCSLPTRLAYTPALIRTTALFVVLHAIHALAIKIIIASKAGPSTSAASRTFVVTCKCITARKTAAALLTGMITLSSV